jgi:hypothetical protein
VTEYCAWFALIAAVLAFMLGFVLRGVFILTGDDD